MRNRLARLMGAAASVAAGVAMACGHPSGAAAPTPPSATGEAATAAPVPPPSSAPSSSSLAPSSASPTTSADKPTPPGEVISTAVVSVPTEIAEPSVVSPDKVIASLRPKFSACYAAGQKKDPKLLGSVTLSAKIEKDGKVSAVTPKMATGFPPAVIKCLSDHLKSATFAASGGMSYATSIDIPLSFSAN